MKNFIPTIDNVDYNQIYLVDDLKIAESTFGFFKANRELKKAHIKEIKDAILSEPYKAMFIAPIRVDINTYNIIDGQHRYSAFRGAWECGSNEPMRVIFENLPTNDAINIVAKINSTSDNWGIKAYEHKLKEEGNQHILNIEEFGKSHPICQKVNKKNEVVGYYPRYVYAILFGKNITKEVKNGSVVVTDEDLVFGDKIYNEVEKLIHSLNYDINSWFESFAHSWYDIRKNDRIYNRIIDNLGIDFIAKHIADTEMRKNHPVTSKGEWDKRLRTAIGVISERKERKEI